MIGLYAGLDVSDETTSICVIKHSGEIILETQASTSPAAISGVLKPYRRTLKYVGHESGTKAHWLHKGLLKRRLPMVCLDARHTHAALAANRNKTDKTDALGIATVLCRGLYRTAHIKSDEAQRIWMLLTLRRALQRKAIDLQLSLRMSIKTLCGDVLVRDRGLTLSDREWMHHALVKEATDALVRGHIALTKEVKGLDATVRRVALHDPVCRRLMTIPGVGPITALSFRAAVDDPHRFSSSRAVGAYFGLTPRRFQSGTTDIGGRISRRGDADVRSALYEAASVLVSVTKTRWPLRTWGLALKKRRGHKFAAVACARRLAVVMHRIWVTDSRFEEQRI